MSESAEQELLQAQIEQLRGELGETVEELAHRANVPARAKERGRELTQQVKEQALDAAERARHAVSRTGAGRWPVLAGAGVALIALLLVVRRRRAR